jgi:hypothetical protein
MSEGVEIALDVEAIRRKGPESYNTLTTTDKLHHLYDFDFIKSDAKHSRQGRASIVS